MESNRELTSQGRNARTEYLRQWRKKNPDKCKKYNDRYWSKRAAQPEKKQTKENTDK